LKTSDISVELIGYYGSDWDVCNAARVSFHKNADEYSRAENEKLIKYLAKHGHYSPFNHCFLSFRVKAPIFVARQLVKHKFLPWNEVSRRYVDDDIEIYFREFHRRAVNKKQGCDENVIADLPYGNYLDDIQKQVGNYNEAIDLGAAPEDARMLLPQCMLTEWVWSGTLGAWLDMLSLRLKPDSQFDSRIVAAKIFHHVDRLFPISTDARLAL